MGFDRALLFRLATSQGLERVAKAVPGGRAGAWRAASRYVAGRSRAEAIHTAAELLGVGHGVSVDLFGELVYDVGTAERVVEAYLSLTDALPPPPADVWLSVDLTHLALDTDPAGTADRLAAIVAAVPLGRRVQVGAEDAAGFRLAERDAGWSIATHDSRLREALLLALGPRPVEQLLGVRPEVLKQLHARDVPTRVYTPYGADWFRYWMRRLAESRGA